MTTTFQISRNELRNEILNVTESTFALTALKVFQFQYSHNTLYRAYLDHLGCNPTTITRLEQIPFLPIEFFKSHSIQTSTSSPVAIFESSGTTGSNTSRHYLKDADLYHKLSEQIFEAQYGSLSEYHILALLPSYLERTTSSLVYMVQHFIQKTASAHSGFYLHNTAELDAKINQLASLKDGKKLLIIGVTFALLDWVESESNFDALQSFPDVIVMETGGMKGRRKELLREEVHALLLSRMPVASIHSEYGMTELISQAYSKGEGWFHESKTLHVLIRDATDPFTMFTDGNRNGGINVIDLGNLDSCSFIETKDLGRFNADLSAFQVLGRFDNSDTRGCNLLVS